LLLSGRGKDTAHRLGVEIIDQLLRALAQFVAAFNANKVPEYQEPELIEILQHFR
jgi:hypothetical protein